MLSFVWSLLVLLFPNTPVPLSILWWLYQAHQSKLVSPLFSCSTVFSVLKQDLGTFLSFRFLSVLTCDQLERQSPLFGRFSFFFFSSLFLFFFFFFLALTITLSGSVAEIRWSVCISKSQRILGVSFSKTDSGLFIYHFFVWSNLNFLHNSQWIIFSTKMCLALYSFCVNLLYSLIMWLIVSSLSPYDLHLRFCRVLAILALIWLFLMALFWAAIWRVGFSLKVSFSSPYPSFLL